MSHHLVTVCMFCLLCAAHTTCGAHINRYNDDNDAAFSVVEFGQGTTERALPFDLGNGFGEFDREDETLDPYHVEQLKDHGIKKKNLSEEKKMRYLQKLSKIRTHRRIEEAPLNDRIPEITHVSEDSLSGKYHVGEKVDSQQNEQSDHPETAVSESGNSGNGIYLPASELNGSNKRLHVPVSELEDSDKGISGGEQEDGDKDIHAPDSELDDREKGTHARVSEFDDSEKSLHIPISENGDVLDRVSGVDVKKRLVRDAKIASVKNVDPSEYVSQIFRLFGDAESMTMNVTGFNAMLGHLGLYRMKEGGKLNTNMPESVYSNVREENANRTCVTSAELISTVNTRLKRDRHNHDHTQLETLDEVIVNEESFKAICPILLYQQMANTSDERFGCVIDNLFAAKITALGHSSTAHGAKTSDALCDDKTTTIEPAASAYNNRTLDVWIYSTLSIFAISACGLLGVAVVPIMHKNYYNHIMQYLIALAIGTLGGDAFLHLIPHALSGGHSHGSHEDSERSHNDGMWKGLAAMMGVVFFYFIEKGLTVIAEWRKRRQKLDKENKLPSRVRVMKEGTSGVKPTSTSSTSSFLRLFNSKCKKQEDPDAKSCKHKYSEYPYCYDEISTDTHDHHHHRDGQKPSSPKGGKKTNNSVSIVSTNNLADKENEPTAKDWLLYKDEGENGGKNVSEFVQKEGVEMNNINHKDSDHAKEVKGEESYTVILREHSRAHHGHSHSHGHVHAPPSSLSSVVWMVIMGDGLHNFTDGMAIGAAFASSIAVGFSTAIAVLCHELPHELGDFAVLLKAGMSVRRAIFYNVLSSVLCVAGMVCGVLVGNAPAATSWVFAVAAGLFIYIALADLVPELSSSHSKEGTLCQCMLQLLGLCTGVLIMLLIALYEHDLETMFG